MTAIDLNADLGEGFDDEKILPFVTSCNIACGGHAGDAATMASTLRAAKRLRVFCGAHPGYPDPENFGRRELPMTLAEISETVTDQIHALGAQARRVGVSLTHVKPHGALYHVCNRRRDAARAVAQTVARGFPHFALVGFAGSILLDEGERAGLRVAAEAFADRRYAEDGTLLPRGHPAALLDSPEEAAAQAVSIVRDGCVIAAGGASLPVKAQTICLHGDTPGAVENARAVREALERSGLELRGLASGG